MRLREKQKLSRLYGMGEKQFHNLFVEAENVPGVTGWPDHACRGCSMVADQVAHVAHLNARGTTLVFVSRAPQAVALTDMLGSFCDLYNAACLQQRIEAYRRRGRTLSYSDQASELKAVRLIDERLASYSYSAEQQVVRRLDKAFRAFFGRVRTGKGGFPRFRAKSMFDSADFRVGDGLTIRKSKKLGIVGILSIAALFVASGGRAVAVGTYLQRAWRDAHAGRVHAANDPERALKMFGDLEFGHKIDPGMY